jgi:ABC-type branched-subunit amino acid transport system substrate-binding protein
LACGLLAGCGLRVPESELKAATAAAEGGGGAPGSLGASGEGGAGQAAPPASAQAASSGAGAPEGGMSGVAAGASGVSAAGSTATGASGKGSGGAGPGGAATAGSSVTTRAGSAAAALPPGGNGGATDVGVTATTITVGNVSDVGGPVPGLFEGGPYGTQAYFDYVNSQGGVYGRKLRLVTADDELQCSQNEADYANLVGTVFAFVGSWSLDDNCGAQVMRHHLDVPMVQMFLSPQMGGLPDAYSVDPYTTEALTGPFLYFKSKDPSDITAVGTLVGNQASAVAAWEHYKTAIEDLGYKVIYEDDFPPAQSNFTADVIRMKAAGVRTVILISVNAPDAAIFASEAAEQGFRPRLWICPVCYAGTYVSEAGGPSDVQGQYAYLQTADFLGDPGVPEVSTFLHWMHEAYPNFVPDEFAAYSWANAALFVHALEQAGPDLTRAKVLSALASTTSYGDHGMVASVDVGARKPSPCYNILEIDNGAFVKVDDPPSGFRCDGGFLP